MSRLGLTMVDNRRKDCVQRQSRSHNEPVRRHGKTSSMKFDFRIPPHAGPRCMRSSAQASLRIVLIATSVALSAGQAAAINPNRTLSQALLRKWQVQQGLPQATIFSIRQTTDGYLWLGSQSGLFRFDGTRFSLPPDEQAVLENAWIEDLCEDAEGNLWIATDGSGLIQLKPDGTISRFGQADGLLSEELRCLYYDRQGNLWIGASAGAARFRAGKFETLAAPAGDELRDVWTFGETPDGTIWIGGDGNRLRSFSQRRTRLAPPGGASCLWLGASFARNAGRRAVDWHDQQRLVATQGEARTLLHAPTAWPTIGSAAWPPLPMEFFGSARRTASAASAAKRSKAFALATVCRKAPSTRFAKTGKERCGSARSTA